MNNLLEDKLSKQKLEKMEIEEIVTIRGAIVNNKVYEINRFNLNYGNFILNRLDNELYKRFSTVK